jgi:CubicO group peptidase (beta-lactamase class C family)
MGKINRIGVYTITLVALALTAHAQVPDQASRLKDVGSAIEAARIKHHIPGLSVAIVKDGKMIFAHGFGLRDVAKNLPATENTRYAIGSCTKAFTAMACAMAADEKKLSFDDSPKKFLPDFMLHDPDADAKVTLRDMLCHRTGLGSTDLAWITGTLNRDQVIRAAAFAIPTAKLGEKWQYQNVMYSAAGECAGVALGSTWDNVIAERFFKPLEMNNSDTSVPAMQKAADFSLGYDINEENGHRPILLPTRNLANIAPAGAINSSVSDMSHWLQFLLAGGEVDGRRLVSKPNFDECFKKQISLGGDVGYAFGWAIMRWREQKVAAHSGGIDGFNSYVAVMPSKRVGLVVLTNVSASPVATTISNAVWENFAEPTATTKSTAPTTAADSNPAREAGTYNLEAINLSMEIEYKDGKLTASVPGQPTYTLVNVGGRRYRMEGLPDGFFMTFRPAKDHPDQAEMFLEQPQGDYVVPKSKPDATAHDAAADNYSGPGKELIGEYAAGAFKMKLAPKNGKIVATTAGQPAYTLTPIPGDKDGFTMPPAPAGFEIHVQRNGDKIAGLLIKQPQGDITLKRVDNSKEPALEDVIASVIKARGGEQNLRKHTNAVTSGEIDFQSQGVKALFTSKTRAPYSISRSTEFHALDRTIGSVQDRYDGSRGLTGGSFIPTRPMSGDSADQMRLEAAFYGPLQWKELFKSITLTGSAEVDGQECFILEQKPSKGSVVKCYVSKSSGRILRRDLSKAADVGAGAQVTELYSDFRDVDGVKIPFKTVQKSQAQGESIAIIKISEVKFDQDMPDELFKVNSGG